MRHLLFSDLNTLNSFVTIDGFPRMLPTNSIQNDSALLTGTTGFIGGFLLKELLQRDSFSCYTCMVRAGSEATGFKRIKSNLLAKGAPSDLIDPRRIKVIIGDVLKPQFGLNDEVFVSLAATVDHVFHFAATMNWVTPFNQDTIANIEAMKCMARFCATARLKKLHYASSMGMWTLLHHREGSILETEIHQQGHELPGGYFQSKWVNEKILRMAAEAGLPVNVYRIGDVKGSSLDGMGDPQNFGNLVMQYFIRNGVVIDSDTPEFNFIPVDYLTQSIAHLAIHQTGKTFQFSNPDLISFRHIFDEALATGNHCRLIDQAEWVRLLRSGADPLGKVLTPIFRKFTPVTGSEPVSFYDIGVNMFKKLHDTTHTDQAMEGTGNSCPAMIRDGILKKYLVHLGQTPLRS